MLLWRQHEKSESKNEKEGYNIIYFLQVLTQSLTFLFHYEEWEDGLECQRGFDLALVAQSAQDKTCKHNWLISYLH